MWHDICLANQAALLSALEHFQVELARVTELVKTGDGEGIRTLFTRAKRLRDQHTV